jgi:DNA-binding NtrC family response regulator
MGNVLVVDDKEGIRTFIAEVLSDAGHDVEAAKDGRDALAKLGNRSFHLMISDLKMPNMDGMQLLEKARTIAPEMAVIVLTAHGTVDTAVAAMKMGAFDYLMKPLSGPDELQMLVSRALDHRVTYMGSITAGEEASDMVAEDPKMKAVLSLISKVAVTDATVLLLG